MLGKVTHLLHRGPAPPLRRRAVARSYFNVRPFSARGSYEADDQERDAGLVDLSQLDGPDDCDDAADEWTLDSRDGIEEHVKQKVRVRRAQHSNRRFVDRIRVKATGGHGGNGCASFFSESAMRKRPNGGHGGAGGDVVVEANDKMQDLSSGTHHFKGGAGTNGMRK